MKNIMLSLVFVGTEKIQGFVNNNKPYNSQKATKFATKKKQSIIYINKKATKKNKPYND